MKKTTFDAQVALLNVRWPWPDEANEANAEYRVRIWAKVCDWQQERVSAFKRAVAELVDEGRYGARPTVEHVLERCRRFVCGLDDDTRDAQAAKSREEMHRYYESGGRGNDIPVWVEDSYRRKAGLDDLNDYDGANCTAVDRARVRAVFAKAAARLGAQSEEIKSMGRAEGDKEEYTRRQAVVNELKDAHKQSVIKATKDYLEGQK